MNSRSLKIWVAVCPVLLTQVIAGELVQLRYDEGPANISLNDARDRFLRIKEGDKLKAVIAQLGYPDEVRVPHLESAEGEWRRWCYGVSQPGALPMIGAFSVRSNLTIGFVRCPARDPWTGKPDKPWENVSSRVEDVFQNPSNAPELRYKAKVSVSNHTGKEIAIFTEQPNLRYLLFLDVANVESTIVFSRRPWPMRSEESRRVFRVKPDQTVSDELFIFLSDITLGIPIEGKFRIRVGLPLTESVVAWSDWSNFDIHPPGGQSIPGFQT
jgi:hypothetical protein